MAEAARLEDAAVDIGRRRVLGPLSVVVREGEHWALLGPNGSGKTTLFSLLGAQRSPSCGTVQVLGERLGRTDMRRLRGRLGLVSHSVADALALHVSALEVVLTGKSGILAPWWGSFDEAERLRAKALLSELSCGHLVGQPLSSCSQGERQRVLLARSLFGGHRLLLLDEPGAGVDLPGREALVAALDRLAASGEGPTTVHSAHTLEELPGSVTHALLLREGRPVASGPAEEVLTGRLLSECFAMALTVERRDGRLTARALGGPGGNRSGPGGATGGPH